MIIDNYTVTIREIVANTVPEGMILALAADKQQRFACSYLFII
jgi:hypothetical protein